MMGKKMQVGIKKLPMLIEEKSRNPDVTVEELRDKYGNLWLLNSPSLLGICLQRVTNPCASLQDIGTNFGLTRERIRQILKRARLPTKAFKPDKNKYYCLNCGKPSRGQFCNSKCRNEYSKIYVACEVCGKLVKRYAKLVVYYINKMGYEHVWCSKYCQGVWLGKNYGRSQKYDYELVKDLYLKGLKYKEIAEIIKTTKNTVGNIISKLGKQGEINLRFKPNPIRTKLIEELLIKKTSCKEIFQTFNISKSRIYAIKDQLRKKGALNNT